jgi:hypothetical protein
MTKKPQNSKKNKNGRIKKKEMLTVKASLGSMLLVGLLKCA